MEQFLQFNIGQIVQVVLILFGFGVMFQKLRDDIKNQGARLEKVEKQLDQVQSIVVSSARQDERISAMDQRMLIQGTRIDSTASILNGRLEAINNIVSGHTAQLNSLPRNKP
jgi:small-conductance mechanosensitive channel